MIPLWEFSDGLFWHMPRYLRLNNSTLGGDSLSLLSFSASIVLPTYLRTSSRELAVWLEEFADFFHVSEEALSVLCVRGEGWV